MVAQRTRVGFVGTAVEDIRVTCSHTSVGGSKSLGKMDLQLGGGAINGARQAQRLGTDTALVAFVGHDDFGRIASRECRKICPNCITVPGLDETRISIIMDDRCVTSRPELEIRRMPSDGLSLLQTCDVVMVAPATPADTDFLIDLMEKLPTACTRILQLSNQQLSDEDNACRLMEAADIVILNEAEVCRFAGTPYPESAFAAVLASGARNLVVTSTVGVNAEIDDRRFSLPAFRVDDVKLTVGAGDVFAGTFAVYLTSDCTPEHALTMGLGAAALHVMGQTGITSPHEFVTNRQATARRVDSGGILMSQPHAVRPVQTNS